MLVDSPTESTRVSAAKSDICDYRIVILFRVLESDAGASASAGRVESFVGGVVRLAAAAPPRAAVPAAGGGAARRPHRLGPGRQRGAPAAVVGRRPADAAWRCAARPTTADRADVAVAGQVVAEAGQVRDATARRRVTTLARTVRLERPRRVAWLS